MRILFIGPHIDDIELACLGTLLKAKAAGHEILYLVLCRCEDLERNKKFLEENKSIIDEIPIANPIICDCWNTRLNFSNEKERIRKTLEDLRTSGVDLVIGPYRGDIHQDHASVAEEMIRVFRYCSVLQYEIPHSSRGFSPNYYVPIPDDLVEKKIELCGRYKSQAGLEYWAPESIRSTLKFRGLQAGTKYAEAFVIWEMRGLIL